MRRGRGLVAVLAVATAVLGGAAGCGTDSAPSSDVTTAPETAASALPQPTTTPEGRVVVAAIKVFPSGEGWDQALVPAQDWGGIDHTMGGSENRITSIVTDWGDEYDLLPWSVTGVLTNGLDAWNDSVPNPGSTLLNESALPGESVAWEDTVRGTPAPTREDRYAGLMVKREYPVGAIFFTVTAEEATEAALTIFDPCAIMREITEGEGMIVAQLPLYCQQP